MLNDRHPLIQKCNLMWPVATQMPERAMMRSYLMRMGAGELVMTTFMKLTMMLIIDGDS